ncbi:MAG: gamma-glutamyltransferase, partial [Bryobacteraceae bacterium]|nr:gamma-glutamyltransferase [Bryobacteraceae bacterium]
AHELASQAGLQILRKGGNAVDAAVAVGFALAVVHPEAGNLGGGGYIVVRMADGRARAIDYKETAPAAAVPGLYANPLESRVGYKASAVPGTVAGLAMAQKMFGSLPWKDVLEPAYRLAREGFPASQRMELILALQVPVMKDFADSAKVFLHGSNVPLKQSEILKQPDLARTIRRLRQRGWREFYEGETARLIDTDMRSHGGTITLADLKSYIAHDLPPLEGSYRGYKLLTIPPSSSGGIALLEMLNVLETFSMPVGEEGSFRSRHLQVEAMRRAFRDRSEFAADPAFFPIPVDRLISKEHGREIAGGIQADRATASASLGGPAVAESGRESDDTTHFSVVDEAGNIVSNTYTLNGFYGSQVIPKGTGVLMNDIMSGFSMTQGSRNEIGPGKRPVSSMTPVIALYPDGKPFVALGSPGSATIPNTLLGTIVNLVDYKMSLRDAIEFPRIHHQFRPDRIESEPAAMVLDVVARMLAAGHVVNPVTRSQGDVHAVGIASDGWRIGWSDGRRGGRAAGY